MDESPEPAEGSETPSARGSDRARPLQDAPRCHHCRDVIGVYEPIVALVGGEPLHTSGAAAPKQVAAGRPCFHLDCFTRASPLADG